MKIGIDISQTAFQGTGVANYLINLLEKMTKSDDEYILFFSSLRAKPPQRILDLTKKGNITLMQFLYPPTLLNLLWNNMHIMPIENFIGSVDVFISSDWTQPPVKSAASVTILYDLIVYKYPEETASTIVATHKKRLMWVKKECQAILCISKSTKKDAEQVLGIEPNKLFVTYPGVEV